mgnify:FL=1
MVKNILSSFEFDSDIQIIGIAYHLPDYRLSFSINQQFGFNFKKLPDLPVFCTKNKQPLPFSLYFYEDGDLLNSYYLISNENGKLVPSFHKIDFFLIITGGVEFQKYAQMLKTLRNLPNVITAVNIEVSSVKNYDNILHDLEIHMNKLTKPEKRQN